ncbi:hypothetical protein TNCV_2317221 [Trichonephila clavipes]|nr:hypothetical protein TNCV_2317221 [Trichonephila clavipes]
MQGDSLVRTRVEALEYPLPTSTISPKNSGPGFLAGEMPGLLTSFGGGNNKQYCFSTPSEGRYRLVIFSDEGKFRIFRIKGRKLECRKPCTALRKEHLVPMVKHGGGAVMVWGSRASNNVAKLE